MMLYSGNAASHHVEVLRRRGWGRMIGVQHWRTPLPGLPWALDNGAFSAHQNRRPFDHTTFQTQYARLAAADPAADFVVVPDIVGGGRASLRFSLDYRKHLHVDTPHYLAVQDGMSPREVEQVLPHFDGIFIGGTYHRGRGGNDASAPAWRARNRGWKWITADTWTTLAHQYGLKSHMGGCGTYHDVQHALALGLDSIDCTSWATNDHHHHAEAAIDKQPPPAARYRTLTDFQDPWKPHKAGSDHV